MIRFSRLRLIFLSVVLFVIEGVLSFNKFCPVMCANQACTTNITGSCTGCFAPWTWNTTTSTCELYATSGYGLVDNSMDMGGSITPDITT